MKINGILLVGFVLLISLLFTIGYLPLMQTQRVIAPLATETSETLSITYDLITYSDEPNKILYYEESMSHAIARYIYTGEEKWLAKYNSLESILDITLKAAIQNGNYKDREDLAVVSALNKETLEIERNTIFLVKNGESEKAIELIDGEAYTTQKNLTKETLAIYVLRKENDYQNAISASKSEIETILENANGIIDMTSKQVLLLSVIAILIALALGNLIYYSVTRPLKKISNAIEKITQGDLNVQIESSDVYEIQSLVYSMNRVIASLKLAVMQNSVSKSDIGLGNIDAICENVIKQKKLNPIKKVSKKRKTKK